MVDSTQMLVVQPVTIGPVEAAESSLVDDRVIVAWCELVEDVGAPLVSRQHTVLDAEVKKEMAVRHVLRAEIGQVGQEAHLQVDDLHSGVSGASTAARVGATAAWMPLMPIPALSNIPPAEGVLHIDDDYRGSSRIDLDRRGSGLDLHGLHSGSLLLVHVVCPLTLRFRRPAPRTETQRRQRERTPKEQIHKRDKQEQTLLHHDVLRT
jgi:hypothetical protein